MALAELINLYNLRYPSGSPSEKYSPMFNYITYSFTSSTLSASETVISEILPGGLLIDTPGTYILSKCIQWTANTTDIAITITANNVTLDLQSHSLCPKQGIGISVIGATNVTIRNGVIKGAQLHAIQVTSSINVTIDSIKICNLRNSDSSQTPAGILSQSCINFIMNKITVADSKTCGASLFGVLVVSAIGSSLSNSCFNNLMNCNGATAAVGYTFSDDFEIRNVCVSDLRSGFTQNTNAEGHTCIGILPTFSGDMLIEDCKVININGSCDDAHGISLFLAGDSLVQRCIITDVTTGKKGSTSAKTTGIEVYASIVVVRDCRVERITATNPGDKQCTGFSTALSNDVQFINCVAEDVKVFNNNGKICKSAGKGTGYGWAPDVRAIFIGAANDITYQNCTAIDCQVGFDTWFHTNSQWTNIKVAHNCQDVLIEPGAQRTYTCNRCSECPGGLTTTLTNIASNNQVDTPTKARSCVCP